MAALSIVIPARNVATTLPAQLHAIASAAENVPDVEIIIADNGSTDATASIGRNFEASIPIHVIDASREAGINVARNEGVAAASGPWILMCDGDDEVDELWIERMREQFESGNQLLAGPIDYGRLNPEFVRHWRGADAASVYTALDYLPSGHGANCGFTRCAFDAVGGFDEHFRGGGDDTDFFWRVQLAGFELCRVPEAVVHYRLRPRLNDVWRQSSNYASSEALLAAKFGLRRRNVTAPLADVWWLISRAPLALQRNRRGPWVRRLAEFYGRLRGAARCRVIWW